MNCNFCLFEFGSTSLKFYYQLSRHGSVQLRGSSIRKFKVPWTIGQEVFRTGFISGASVVRGVAAVRDILESFIPDSEIRNVVAFATGVFRDAANTAQFFDLVRSRTGLRVHVIDKDREAALLQASFLRYAPTAPAFVFDLGGGSFQWVEVLDRGRRHRGCLPLGVYRLHSMVDREWGGVPIPLTFHVVDRLFENIPPIRVDEVTGTGGTVKAIKKTLRKTVISREEISALEARIRSQGPPPQLKPHRRPIFLAGVVIVRRLMAAVGASELHYRDLSVGKAMLAKVLPYYRDPAAHDLSASRVLDRLHYSEAIPPSAVAI